MDTAHDTPSRPRRRRGRRPVIASAVVAALALGAVGIWAAVRFLIEHVVISDVFYYDPAQSMTDDVVTNHLR